MIPSVSQIRTSTGGEKSNGGKDPRADQYNQSLSQGLKQYKKEKTPELKAKLSSDWRMASMQGVNIDPKLSEQVKKIVGKSDLSPQDKVSTSGGSGSGPCGSGPCGSAPDSTGGADNLLGGLAGNFQRAS